MSSLRADAIGNLGNDAEVRYLPDATPVVSFNVATSPYVKRGEKERTNWVRCSFFGSRAEAVKPYLLKGVQVHVHGDLDMREWTGNDGAVRHSLEIRVSELDLLGSRGDGQTQGQQSAVQQRNAALQEALDDDSELPF